MRRLVAILLLVFLPLQLAWSVEDSMHGHLDDAGAVSGFHVHDHDHDDPHHDDHGDQGHHDGHFHPVFTMLVMEPCLHLGAPLPDGPPSRPQPAFTSHIPLLFDWPPSARV